MHHSFIITHVARVSGKSPLVNALPNAEFGDLVFITENEEDETPSFGVLTERVDDQEHIWSVRLLSSEAFLHEICHRLRDRKSGEDANRMFMPILNASPSPAALERNPEE